MSPTDLKIYYRYKIERLKKGLIDKNATLENCTNLDKPRLKMIHQTVKDYRTELRTILKN
jgi:hypothetical protein